MSQPAAGWYPDPQDRTGERWWDGSAWTSYTHAGTATATSHPSPVATPALPSGYPGAPGYAFPVAETHPAQYGMAQSSGGVQPYGTAAAAVQPYAVSGQYALAAQRGAYAPAAESPIGVWRSPVDNRPFVRGMGDAIKIVFAKYAQFEGRASRPEYWYFYLFSALVTIGAVVLLAIPFVNIIALFAVIAWAFGALVPTYAVLVRRLRDAGYHWAWIFISFVPFGGIALIVFCCQPSKHP